MSIEELVQAMQGEDVMALGDRQDVQHKTEGVWRVILQSVDSVLIGRSCPSSNEARGQPYPDKEQSSRRLMMFLSGLWVQVCEFRRLIQITNILKQAVSLTMTLPSFFILLFLSLFPPSFPFSFLLSFSFFPSFLLMSTTILGFFILK